MRVGALCCGMGNFAKGMERAGHEIVWGVDLDIHATKTFAHRFPEADVFHSDVSEGFGLNNVDVIVAGFPCQPFSRIGQEQGFADSRTNVLETIMWQARRLQAEYVILENVPASLNYQDTIEGIIRMTGYEFITILKLNAYKDCGIPQDRTRIFFICSKKQPFSDIFVSLSKKNSIDAYIDRSIQQEKRLYYDENSYSAVKNIPKTSTNLWNMYGKHRVREKKDGLCPTLLASMGTGGNNIPLIRDDFGVRKLSWQECVKLQGIENVENVFPDGISNTQKYKMIGNSVCEPMAEKIGAKI